MLDGPPQCGIHPTRSGCPCLWGATNLVDQQDSGKAQRCQTHDRKGLPQVTRTDLGKEPATVKTGCLVLMYKFLAPLSLGDGQQVGLFILEVIPYGLLNNRDHCFSLMNGKQLKGEVISLFKRKSDSPHCINQQKNIVDARGQNIDWAESCYASTKHRHQNINPSSHQSRVAGRHLPAEKPSRTSTPQVALARSSRRVRKRETR